MIDLEPRLDARLRAFYDHVESEIVPSRLSRFEPAAKSTGRRALSVFAGVAGIAVVAAGAVVFALELGGRHSPTPPAPAASASLPKIPVFGGHGIPASALIVIGTTRGEGNEQLRTFVPAGTVYIQFACSAAGPADARPTSNVVSQDLGIHSTNTLIGQYVATCSGAKPPTTVTAKAAANYDGKPLTLEVTAGRSTAWEIVVAQSVDYSFPPLGGDRLPSGAQVLIPATYGTGSVQLPEVTPTGMLFIQYACTGGGSFSYLSGGGAVGSALPACGGGGAEAPLQSEIASTSPMIDGKPLSLNITAAPTTTWEILVADSGSGPLLPPLGGTSLPAGAQVLVPATFGVGTSSVDSSTPARPLYIQYACFGTDILNFEAASASEQIETHGNCADGGVGTEEVSAQVFQGVVDLTVHAAPGQLWEALLYEQR